MASNNDWKIFNKDRTHHRFDSGKIFLQTWIYVVYTEIVCDSCQQKRARRGVVLTFSFRRLIVSLDWFSATWKRIRRLGGKRKLHSLNWQWRKSIVCSRNLSSLSFAVIFVTLFPVSVRKFQFLQRQQFHMSWIFLYIYIFMLFEILFKKILQLDFQLVQKMLFLKWYNF